MSELATPFDPEFDDARWTLAWADVQIMPVPLGRHPNGYEVIERMLEQAQIFDRIYKAHEPFPVRALLDPQGKLWMSDTPQERMMMYNNAMQSRGHILVGGLGLGMYQQYAAAHAKRFTIVERSPEVCEIVGSMLEHALGERRKPVPFELISADVEDFLAAEASTRYDTIFLDTWDTLEAIHLPRVNRLRDLAIRHLTPDPQGRVLLWGYRWMVRLFEDACKQLLDVPPERREEWLVAFNQPQAASLLQAVIEEFAGRVVDDIDGALQWCREYIVSVQS